MSNPKPMLNQKCGGCGSEYHVSAGVEVQRSRCWRCGAVAMTDELERNYNLSKNFPAPGTVVYQNEAPSPEILRTFESGATRDLEEGKLDFEGFLSPQLIEAFGIYMNINRTQADGTQRESDNWQKGMPISVFVKSGWRHFFDWWRIYRLRKNGGRCRDGLELMATMGLLFNLQGYLHERTKEDGIQEWLDREEAGFKEIRAEELQERRDNAKTQ